MSSGDRHNRKTTPKPRPRRKAPEPLNKPGSMLQAVLAAATASASATLVALVIHGLARLW